MRVNHTIPSIFVVVFNEKQTDWDEQLPQVEFAYDESLNIVTGLAQR